MTEISGNKILNHAELEEELKKTQTKAVYHEENRGKKYRSLDSDEEDEKAEAQKYNVLDPNELEGQEEKTIDYDDEIKITPFNMKEELEEGYFDKDGTYIFQKEEGVIKDQWLDDIDWVKVKTVENYKRKGSDDSDEDSNEALPELNLLEHYKKMLELMQPKETVQKAIVRLGGSKHSGNASSRWKKKKESEDMEEDSRNEENRERMKSLTSFANDIIQSGNMDIYQQTYEKLAFYVNSKEKANVDDNSKDNESLDMFGDDFNEKVDELKDNSLETDTSNSRGHTESAESGEEVLWEFKWETGEDAKVYGRYPTSQMLQWVQEKYFENGVLVRQVGKEGQFYSSKRIDFELYL